MALLTAVFHCCTICFLTLKRHRVGRIGNILRRFLGTIADIGIVSDDVWGVVLAPFGGWHSLAMLKHCSLRERSLDWVIWSLLISFCVAEL
jgi:hypothetical protein